MVAHPAERPWTCTIYTGTDGSRIFRGGIGHSLVIDPDGRLWRARSYEDSRQPTLSAKTNVRLARSRRCSSRCASIASCKQSDCRLWCDSNRSQVARLPMCLDRYRASAGC
jgi:hypothetical protein